jgi:hypothetical protein
MPQHPFFQFFLKKDHCPLSAVPPAGRDAASIPSALPPSYPPAATPPPAAGGCCRLRLGERKKAFHWIAVGVAQEVGEVPLDLASKEFAQLLFQVFERTESVEFCFFHCSFISFAILSFAIHK